MDKGPSARAGLRVRAERARAGGLEGMHEIALQLVQGALSADTRERQPLAAAYVRDGLMRSDADAYARSCEALADAQVARLEEVRAPVLLVTGDEDAVAPPQAMRALAARLTGARSVRSVALPRCGHWTPIERPAECAREWRDFAAAVSRG
jgi:pimeloyl-ACP methyl ester carboxylesterase